MDMSRGEKKNTWAMVMEVPAGKERRGIPKPGDWITSGTTSRRENS